RAQGDEHTTRTAGLATMLRHSGPSVDGIRSTWAGSLASRAHPPQIPGPSFARLSRLIIRRSHAQRRYQTGLGEHPDGPLLLSPELPRGVAEQDGNDTVRAGQPSHLAAITVDVQLSHLQQS